MIETTRHRVCMSDASAMDGVADGSVHLVVTSPPYPMIAMWDACFTSMSADCERALAAEDGTAAFTAMHEMLDAVWAECLRVLCPGGLLCINIGDATRNIGGEFRLWPNHARILQSAMRLGLSVLPDILWRKPNNSPTKFLGSGMLPAGAYVTYEHEYVLILRKGPPRAFRSEAEKRRRRESAFFQEERNTWFSDVWSNLPGVRQDMGESAARERSAAFPFELAYRLIQMYSLIGDTVLDPFLGTGTTALAAAAGGRSSIGHEREPGLLADIAASLAQAPRIGRERALARWHAHRRFVAEKTDAGKAPKHVHERGFPVVTSQEKALRIVTADSIERCGDHEWTATTTDVLGASLEVG